VIVNAYFLSYGRRGAQAGRELGFFMAKSKEKADKTQYETLIEEYSTDFDAQKDYRDTLDAREKFMLGTLNDSYTGTIKSKVNDQQLLTSIIKRTNNVMAQVPSGKVQAITKKNIGKNILFNLILTKYIQPNAKSQFDMYTKFWLLQFLSSTYGAMDLMVDYVVSDKYVGPDFMLIPRRNGIPEAGKISVDECERYWVQSYVTDKWLLTKKKEDGWKNIDKIIEQGKKSNKVSDQDKTSYAERDRQSELQRAPGISLLTKYEGDKWTIISEQAKVVAREIDNPFKDGELPIISKLGYPMLDRYSGLSLYELMISLQRGQNSLLNLYLDSLKMKIYPPLKAYLPDMVMSTFKYEPGAIWALKNPNVNAVTEMQFGNTPANFVESGYTMLKAAMNNGTQITDTTISERIDPGRGKTPQALKMQQAEMMVATNFDRKQLELAIEKTFDKFINLLASRQKHPIDLSIFGDEVKELSKNYDDIKDMVEFTQFDSKDAAQVIIKPQKDKSIKYRYFIDTGTTMRKDEVVENETLTSIIELLKETELVLMQTERIY